MKDLVIQLEIHQEEKELQEAGLSREEIEGYFEFFIDNWFPIEKENNGEYLCPRS